MGLIRRAIGGITIFTMCFAMLGVGKSEVFATSNDTWQAIDTSPMPVAGSALDLSFLNDAPAGKHGFVKIDGEGNYYFEDTPSQSIRFYGANLVNGGLFTSQVQARAIADRMAQMGYNVIRIHAQDWMQSWAQGIFTKPTSTEVELNLTKLDQLEYLIAQLKQRGIYVNIDLFTFFDMSAVPDLTAYAGDYAASNILVQFIPAAFQVWQSAAQKWLSHVNPYTGLALKDDPVLIGVSPWNEGLLVNTNVNSASFKPAFQAWLLTDFNQFLSNQSLPPVASFPSTYWAVSGETQNQLASYISSKTLAIYDQMKNVLKNDLHVKAPIGGFNYLDSPLVSSWRTQADIYETHMYHALVQTKFSDSNGAGYVYNPLKFPRMSTTFSAETAASYVKSFDTDSPFFYYYPTLSLRQQYQKPFALTEFNDGLPVAGREEIGIMSSAMGAYQNWDIMNRFEFGGELNGNELTENIPYGQNWLMIAGDPLGIVSEYESSLLFRNNVLQASTPKFVIVRDLSWSRTQGQANQFIDHIENLTYIPHLFNTQTVYADTGVTFAVYKVTPDLTAQQIASGNLPAANKLTITPDMTFKQAAEVFINSLDDVPLKNEMLTNLNQKKLVSDTGELTFDLNLNTYLVNTPKTIAAVGTLNNHTFTFNQGSVTADVERGTFFASSLDQQSLGSSNRIVAMYTTDVKATGEQSAAQTDGTVKYYKGTLPTLAKLGTAQFNLKTLRKADGYKAYQLAMNGDRLVELPVLPSADGVQVQLSTDKGFAFELVYSPLISDDFESGNPLGWQDVNGWGTWHIESEIGSVTNHVYANNYDTKGGLKLVTGQSAWSDYSVSADVYVDAWQHEAGIIGRYQNAQNYYYLSYNSQYQILQICRIQNGMQTVLQTKWFSVPLSADEIHRFKLEVKGNILVGCVDGIQKLSTSDGTLTAGKAGLFAHLQKVHFDNFMVQEIDATPPTSPSHVTAQALNSSQVVVSWSPATDQVGVTQYLIYRDGTLISSTSAQSQTFTDNGLSRGTAYTYAVKAVDLAGNLSTTSSSVTTTTFDSLLQDDFERGNLNSWKDVNGWGTWHIVADEGSNHAYENSDETKGGLKLVAGQNNWSDYSISADMKVDAWHSEAGLVARYTDSQNYYYISYNSTYSILQICRMQNGVQTVLANKWLATQPAAGVYHHLSLAVQGSSLFAYLDNDLILSASDATFSNGKAGFFAHLQKVRFDNVIVKEDTEVPTAPTDVTAIPLSGSQIYVSWGASTDDTGVVSYAVYRDSTQIASVNAKTLNFADNTLLPNTSYTYAVKAVDTASKQSSAGGSVTTVTYSSLMQDDYEHGNLHGWKDVNGWGTWQIISENSSNHVYANGDDTKGGLKLVAGQSVWTDYNVSADVKVDTWKSEVGLIARYVDSQNYYYLSYNSTYSLLQLVRIQNGVQTVLQNKWLASPPASGMYHHLSIEVNGSSLTGYLDGTLLLTASDSSFANGKIGLYAHLQKVKFDNFIVNPVSGSN